MGKKKMTGKIDSCLNNLKLYLQGLHLVKVIGMFGNIPDAMGFQRTVFIFLISKFTFPQ